MADNNAVEKTLEKDFKSEQKTSFDKMLAQNGVKFYEFKTEKGITESIPHVALPVVIKDLPKFYDLLDATESIRNEGKEKMEKLQESLGNFAEESEDTEKLEKKITELKKEMRDINRNYLYTLNKKRLEIAYLCFKRTEKTSIKELEEWVTTDILNQIENVALGITIPPKL